MSGKTRDHLPTFKSAGKNIASQGDSTALCMQPRQEVVETPLHIKKYRKSYKQQAGVTILHHGLADDPKQVSNFVYGKRTDPSDKVNQLLNIKKQGVQELIQEIQEKNYARHQKEPLATVPLRGYNWPSETNQDGFMFGQKIPPSEYTAKEVVFPPDAKREEEHNRLMYLRSHGNFEAGEQKNRQYNWSLDPKQHRFGKLESKELNQMKGILQQDMTQNAFPHTTIIKKNQEDFKNFNDDPLGKPKNLGQMNGHITSDTVFGVVKKGQEWSAGQCIKGQATYKEVETDFDLGKATKFGFRNTAKDGDYGRVFGVPTIRNDIQRKGIKSVADPQNYGDEKPAVALLFPEKFSHMGLSEEDFLRLRNKQEIKEIFEQIGVQYGMGKFVAVYERAKQLVKK